jgi:nitroreductase
MNVSEAIDYRRSVRGFLDKPVDIALVKDIVIRASRAASGGNLQPWHVDIVHGESMAKLKAIMAEKLAAGGQMEQSEYNVYPPELKDPYATRRAEVGENKAGRGKWFFNNFQFFGAPVGLFVSLDRQMEQPQWADAGALLNSIMLLLCEAGLDSCPQECWSIYPKTLGDFLHLPDNRILWTGMSIGYKDPANPANSLRAKRAPAEEWLVLHD